MSSTKVRFRKYSVKSLVQRLEGREPAYPVYFFGKTIKTERPENPGQKFSWVKDISEVP